MNTRPPRTTEHLPDLGHARSRDGFALMLVMLIALIVMYFTGETLNLESAAEVVDGNGRAIPGVKRWLYAGPTGVTSGQYGIFGSIVAIVRDDGGGEVIRRTQVSQESFAKFAYFTDIEPSYISFGGGARYRF